MIPYSNKTDACQQFLRGFLRLILHGFLQERERKFIYIIFIKGGGGELIVGLCESMTTLGMEIPKFSPLEMTEMRIVDYIIAHL